MWYKALSFLSYSVFFIGVTNSLSNVVSLLNIAIWCSLCDPGNLFCVFYKSNYLFNAVISLSIAIWGSLFNLSDLYLCLAQWWLYIQFNVPVKHSNFKQYEVRYFILVVIFGVVYKSDLSNAMFLLSHITAKGLLRVNASPFPWASANLVVSVDVWVVDVEEEVAFQFLTEGLSNSIGVVSPDCWWPQI